MGFEGNRNNVQTLFLISNSFNGFGFGLFLFAFGVGRGTLLGMTAGYAWCTAVGLALVALALLGYCGAIKLNRKMLHIYSLLTIGGAALEIVHLAILNSNLPSPQAVNDLGLQSFYVTMICIIVIAIVSVLLACTLSLQIRWHASNNAGAAAGWK